MSSVLTATSTFRSSSRRSYRGAEAPCPQSPFSSWANSWTFTWAGACGLDRISRVSACSPSIRAAGLLARQNIRNAGSSPLIWKEWECFWFGPTLALVVVDPGTVELAEPPQEDATSAAVTTSRVVAVRALPIASTLPLGTNPRAGRRKGRRAGSLAVRYEFGGLVLCLLRSCFSRKAEVAAARWAVVRRPRGSVASLGSRQGSRSAY
jgi:hypothetical protein